MGVFRENEQEVHSPFVNSTIASFITVRKPTTRGRRACKSPTRVSERADEGFFSLGSRNEHGTRSTWSQQAGSKAFGSPDNTSTRQRESSSFS